MPDRTFEYLAPDTIEEADRLLNRPGVKTLLLAGGTGLSEADLLQADTIVQLANLQLNFIERRQNLIHIGAMTSLAKIAHELVDVAAGSLAKTVQAGIVPASLLQQATIGGMLASGDIHTALSVMLGALNARIKIYKMAGEAPSWAEITKQVRINNGLGPRILTAISLNIPDEVGSLGKFAAANSQLDDQQAARAVASAAVVLRRRRDTVQANIVVGGVRVDLISHQVRYRIGDEDSAIRRAETYFTNLRGPTAMYLSDDIADMAVRREAAPRLVAQAFDRALTQISY